MSIDEQIAAALAAPYTRIFVKQDDGGYQVYVVELPGVMTASDTIEETNEFLEEAMTLWIEAELKGGREIPPPFEDVDALLEIGEAADRPRMEAARAAMRDSA